LSQSSNVLFSIGTPRGAGGGGGCCSPPPPKANFKKHRFCRHADIKGFMWFTLQPKSVTELSWWV